MKFAVVLFTLVLVSLLITDSLSAKRSKKKRQTSLATSIQDDSDVAATGPVDITKLSGYTSKYGQYIRTKEAAWKKAVISVYNMTVYPYNEYYIKQFLTKGASNLSWLPQVINASACARVHAFGDHCTPLSIAEYFYGLTPNTITFEVNYVYILAFDLVRFFINVDTNTAFSTINYRIGMPGLPSSTWFNSTQVGTFRFDNNDKIVETDLWNPLYSAQIRESGVLQAPDYAFQMANYTCYRHDKFCKNTPYKQYADYSDCMKFMMNLKVGDPDVFSGNNLQCRNQHSTLIQLRPQIHCPHLGPSGGGFCVDRTVASFHTIPFFTDSNRLIAPIKRLN